MKGIVQDLKTAEELYAQDRPGDALIIIDRILELSIEASADDTAGILRQALQHVEKGPLEGGVWGHRSSRWHLGDPIAPEPNFVPPPRLLRVSDRH